MPKLIKSRRSCIGCGMRPGALYANGLCLTCQYPDDVVSQQKLAAIESDAASTAERVLSEIADDAVLDAARAAVASGTYFWRFDDEHDDVVALVRPNRHSVDAVLVVHLHEHDDALADFEHDESWLHPMTKQQLDPAVQQSIDEIVAALPPLTDVQLDSIADVLARIRTRTTDTKEH